MRSTYQTAYFVNRLDANFVSTRLRNFDASGISKRLDFNDLISVNTYTRFRLEKARRKLAMYLSKALNQKTGRLAIGLILFGLVWNSYRATTNINIFIRATHTPSIKRT